MFLGKRVCTGAKHWKSLNKTPYMLLYSLRSFERTHVDRDSLNTAHPRNRLHTSVLRLQGQFWGLRLVGEGGVSVGVSGDVMLVA